MPRRPSKFSDIEMLDEDEQDLGSENDEMEEEEVFGLKDLSDEDSDEETSESEERWGRSKTGYHSSSTTQKMDDDEANTLEERGARRGRNKAAYHSDIVQLDTDEEASASEEQEAGWGHSKAAYYSSNAAQLETDDEEANALEEQEARRLQSKARDSLCEDDFGLADLIVGAEGHFVEPVSHVLEPLPQDKQGLIRHLEKNSPEALALARDWEDTARNLMTTKARIQMLEMEAPDALSLGMVHLHYQVLLTYATTLAFFLHLRSSEKYAQRPELLKSHPVFSRLLTLKQSLTTLEDLDYALSDESDIDASDIDDYDINDYDIDDYDLLMDAQSLEVPSPEFIPPTHQPPKKKRKVASSLPVFDLVEPVYSLSKSTSTNPSASNDSTSIDAYGEATSLQHADQADKNARKKSLRFHTSKIASASARRQGARSNMVGGDDDIPYKERRKEVAPVKGMKKNQRHDESGDDGADEDADEDGYYELVKRKAKDKKAKKKADYEEAQVAAHPDVEDASANGPRSLTRAILSNKGLTPHRSKSIRNPRVKKRQKFEKAKKKVSSQKAVYKGGIGDTGRYEGERSGISKVVKSIRLG